MLDTNFREFLFHDVGCISPLIPVKPRPL